MSQKATKTFEQMQREDRDMMHARRFADVMVAMLRDFIPENSRRDAWERLVEASLQEGFELTSKAMREQYEAWKRTEIEGLTLPQL